MYLWNWLSSENLLSKTWEGIVRKQDWERVDWVKIKHDWHSKLDKCKCDMCFLLSILDKQDKVVEAAKAVDEVLSCKACDYGMSADVVCDKHSGWAGIIEYALKELEGEK